MEYSLWRQRKIDNAFSGGIGDKRTGSKLERGDEPETPLVLDPGDLI